MPSPTKAMSDAQIDDALGRIYGALDRDVNRSGSLESVVIGHQISRLSAEREGGQAEGGLQRDALQRGSMLITKESSSRLAAERKSATDDLAGHVGSVLRELNTVRTETTRLLDQRRQLEVYLAALKTELVGLRAEKLEIMALKAQVRPHANTDTEVDLVARARAAADLQETGSGTSAPAPVAASAPALANAVTPGQAGPQSTGVEARGKKDEDAFRAFLLADEDHDKSREWFMSRQA